VVVAGSGVVVSVGSGVVVFVGSLVDAGSVVEVFAVSAAGLMAGFGENGTMTS